MPSVERSETGGAGRPVLHVLFTMDCPPANRRAAPNGPEDWVSSGHAIDAFCTAVRQAGFLPTLFMSPEAAGQHAPLCEDEADFGADVGLLIQPPTLRSGRYKYYLGAYQGAEQRSVVMDTLTQFEDALQRRPLSARSGMYSANDDTFLVLAQCGFRQSSLSSPGRRVPKHQAVWAGAATEPHFASEADRLSPGSLSLVEVPVTTDATQCKGGVAPDLAIENGTLDRWHQPLIEGQLARQEAEGVAFRTLCFTTASRYAYHDRSTRYRQTLDDLMEYLAALEPHYELVPTTLSSAYDAFRDVDSRKMDATTA